MLFCRNEGGSTRRPIQNDQKVSFLLNFILDTHTQLFLSRQCLIVTELEIASSGFERDRVRGKPRTKNARPANRPLLSLSGQPARPFLQNIPDRKGCRCAPRGRHATKKAPTGWWRFWSTQRSGVFRHLPRWVRPSLRSSKDRACRTCPRTSQRSIWCPTPP